MVSFITNQNIAWLEAAGGGGRIPPYHNVLQFTAMVVVVEGLVILSGVVTNINCYSSNTTSSLPGISAHQHLRISTNN